MATDEANAGIAGVTDATSLQVEQNRSGKDTICSDGGVPSSFQREFFLQECTSLHEEINTRMAQRGTLFTFTIITAGSLLSLGASANAQIALFYPVLSLFLAAAWSNEDRKIGLLSAYLHEQEQLYNLAGWENYHRVSKSKPRVFLAKWQPFNTLSFATRGVFLSTQILAILVGFTQNYARGTLLSVSSWPLLSVAVLATIITGFMIQHQRNRQVPEE